MVNTVPGFKRLYDLKLTHVQAIELLRCLCQQISTLSESEFEKTGIQKALFDAIEHGIVELIVELIKQYPDIVWREDESQRGIFLCATLHRQEKIFNLIYRMGAKKNAMATPWDVNHNNILHQAAFLAPLSQLDRVTGAALQMQRELQWSVTNTTKCVITSQKTLVCLKSDSSISTNFVSTK
ncbi:unnamed protein product [Linum tenue]|uniref:Uncharacterized protein n=1 Tax=Linum tenue TaxID=586396 RepID=A0AAV0REH3_9ROSI|nr:unnamed protein product [Linum tenue]